MLFYTWYLLKNNSLSCSYCYIIVFGNTSINLTTLVPDNYCYHYNKRINHTYKQTNQTEIH